MCLLDMSIHYCTLHLLTVSIYLKLESVSVLCSLSTTELTREQLERKVDYCRELLELAETIDPGMSLFRGTLLFELQAALVALAKTLLSNEIVTKDGTQVRITFY